MEGPSRTEPERLRGRTRRNTTVNFAGMLMKRLSFMATTLRARSLDEKGAIRDAVAREVWPLIEAGQVAPILYARFPLRDAAEAHRVMESSVHIGKLVLVVSTRP